MPEKKLKGKKINKKKISVFKFPLKAFLFLKPVKRQLKPEQLKPKFSQFLPFRTGNGHGDVFKFRNSRTAGFVRDKHI